MRACDACAARSSRRELARVLGHRENTGRAQVPACGVAVLRKGPGLLTNRFVDEEACRECMLRTLSCTSRQTGTPQGREPMCCFAHDAAVRLPAKRKARPIRLPLYKQPQGACSGALCGPPGPTSGLAGKAAVAIEGCVGAWCCRHVCAAHGRCCHVDCSCCSCHSALQLAIGILQPMSWVQACGVWGLSAFLMEPLSMAMTELARPLSC
jgi:hypothetical protein